MRSSSRASSSASTRSPQPLYKSETTCTQVQTETELCKRVGRRPVGVGIWRAGGFTRCQTRPLVRRTTPGVICSSTFTSLKASVQLDYFVRNMASAMAERRCFFMALC